MLLVLDHTLKSYVEGLSMWGWFLRGLIQILGGLPPASSASHPLVASLQGALKIHTQPIFHKPVNCSLCGTGEIKEKLIFHSLEPWRCQLGRGSI